MARRKITQKTNTATTTTLALASLPQLEPLLKEKEWLLKQIKRKRTELKNFVDQMRTIAREVFLKADPYYKKIYAFDEEIHSLFQEILTARKLGKKTKKDIENIYRNLQLMGLISPTNQGQEEQYLDLDELFEEDEEEEEEETNTQQQSSEISQDLNHRSNTKEMRNIFLSLAEKFHPDKVTDPETQMRHTEIMKEINRAYKENDLAKLMEIAEKEAVERGLDLENEEEIDRKFRLLTKENQLLTQQYEYLKKELSLAKNTPEGELVKEYRKGKRQGNDLIAEMVDMVEGQLKAVENVKNFVQDFRDKKITIKEFLAGPNLGVKLNKEDLEEIMEQMFEEIIMEMDF
ncbi:MAG: J domain-containing protein [Gomphosphaeria aponina SAG 52.96 = DSM 107014]|uniref:J domain-containing protein n=1 Tax=Gomphosphaeria aponina SAG 52.96 = DSM 107014 TaxID=1521640 RepID=A0A941GSY1_9CHRO|nr:J domain-containing protein [Gomphosphaeria aponina SAG 52.96 = DSM 107014]